MTKPIPQIQKYMTVNPKFVEKTQSLDEAATLMQKEGFRHLPVLSDGKIEGILSMTDVNMVSALKGAEISSMKVMDAFTPNPLIVTPQTAVDEVCRSMAQNKYGCVLVEDNHHLVGVFTWIDALEAMDDLLHTRLK
jgi:acetoin utilization protein AcuB